MVLANGAPAYLQYIADLECNARLGAGYKLIIQRIIIELCTNKNLRTKTMKEEEREKERERKPFSCWHCGKGIP